MSSRDCYFQVSITAKFITLLNINIFFNKTQVRKNFTKNNCLLMITLNVQNKVKMPKFKAIFFLSISDDWLSTESLMTDAVNNIEKINKVRNIPKMKMIILLLTVTISYHINRYIDNNF